ncbi:MAG: hypothetical protein ACRD19_02135 [Terriglobia bacterium]
MINSMESKRSWTISFSGEQEHATCDIESATSEEALTQAMKIRAEGGESLCWEKYLDHDRSIKQVEIESHGKDAERRVIWQSQDLKLRNSAPVLLKVIKRLIASPDLQPANLDAETLEAIVDAKIAIAAAGPA